MGIEDCETWMDLLLFYIGVYPVIGVLLAVSIAVAFVALLAHFFTANSLILLNKKYNTKFPMTLMWLYAFIPGLLLPIASLWPLAIFCQRSEG